MWLGTKAEGKSVETCLGLTQLFIGYWGPSNAEIMKAYKYRIPNSPS